jgi:pimeloyl-ACP methyl ester carboxylesterase
MPEPRDLTLPSHDGRLRLFGRLYGPDHGRRTILCLHGLTRNSLDFEHLARHLADAGHRVLAFDQRGRGRSGWDADEANYQLPVYARDMLSVLDQLQIPRAVLIGTSMGGLMSMLMAASAPERIVGMVINDVGPEIDSRGLDRIRGYVGRRTPPSNWDAAARAVAEDNAVAFPDYGQADWLAFARRLYVEDIEGRVTAAYDPAIAVGLQPTATAVAPPDLWPLWGSLSAFPILAIRGALSDLLSQPTLEQMAARHPGLRTAVIPARGHAPMLDEPDALDAIDRFLASLPPDPDESVGRP